MRARLRSRTLLAAAGIVAGASACNETTTPLPLAGPGTSLEIASGDGQVGAVGDTLAERLTVVVKDASGRPVPGYEITWAATSGSLSTARDTTGSDGTASTALRLPVTPESVTVVAASQGFAPVSFHAYAAAALRIVRGDAQTGGMGRPLADSLVVMVSDSAGCPLPGYLVLWSTTAGVLGATSATTGADGHAATTLRLPDQPATITITAQATGFAPVSFTAVAAAGMQVVRGNTQIGAMGQQLADSLVVITTDSLGHPLPGYLITWNTTAGVLSATSTTTGADGHAATTLRLPDQPATITITAQATGFAPVSFTAVAAAVMQVAQGGNQTGRVATTLPDSLVVVVRDGAGRAVTGYTVRWLASAGGLSSAETPTDSAGRAAVALTLPSAPVAVTVTASALSVPPVSFNAFATPTGAPLVFRYAEAGSYHACGITTEEQSICWGFNEDGQVGAGVPSTIQPMTRVSADRAVRVTSAGRYHSCEITLSGDVWCGGSNTAGQLDGSPGVPQPAFIRVQPQPATGFRMVSAGLLHTCALSLSQQAWCWGSNGEGQLGTDSTTIVPGSSGTPAGGFVGDGYAAISATGLHTCALTVGGRARCWGWGTSGQLGNGADTSAGGPVNVAGGFTFRTEPATVPTAPDPDFYVPGQGFLSAGYAHSCGILTSGVAVCWGDNEDGQLGNGGTTNSNVPVTVSGGLQFRAISAGYRHTCALTTTGVAYCWGNNALDQLGDGTTTSHLAPTAVAGGLTFMSISAGETMTCGVTTGGALYCWGDNRYGQLGQAGMAGSSVPVELPFQ